PLHEDCFDEGDDKGGKYAVYDDRTCQFKNVGANTEDQSFCAGFDCRRNDGITESSNGNGCAGTSKLADMIVDAETRQQHRYKDKCGHCRVVCCFFGEIKKMNVKCGNGLTDNTDQTSDKKGFYTVCKNVSFRLAFLLECLIFLCIGGKIFLFFIRHFISLFLLCLFFHEIDKTFDFFF